MMTANSNMKLHEYQNRIVQFCREHSHCILSVDMGLGKTAAVLNYVDELRPSSLLIVAPKRVAETVWKQEAEKWGLGYISDRMTIIAGTKKKRQAALADGDKPYKIISRDNLADLPVGFSVDVLVLDELTSFKTHDSKRTQLVRNIRAARKIGLTGTFLANGAIDVYGQAVAVGLPIEPSNFWAWRAVHFRDVLEGSGLQFHKWKLVCPLEEVLRPIKDNIFTLSAVDYLTIPPVTEYGHPIFLGEEARTAYDDLQSFLQFEIDGQTMSLDEEQKFCKLQQLCNGFVYLKDEETEEVQTIRGQKSDKLEAVAEFCERCKGENEPVLLFYAYKAEAQWLAEMLQERKLRVGTVKQPGFMERWNNGEIDVLMAHPASAGHGLNLQHGGRILVWSSLTYNYELFAQANARLARQGQNRAVQIHIFNAIDTVEEQQRQALRRKDKDQHAFIELTK